MLSVADFLTRLFRSCVTAARLPAAFACVALLSSQLLKLSEVNEKTGEPVTQGDVPFFALDTLLQFARYEKVPEADKEAVRDRFFWALDHEDLGICTLGTLRKCP